jgi:WD40 repeat protein
VVRRRHQRAVRDLASGTRIHQLTGHRASVTSVAVSLDGRRIVSGADDQTVAVWDLEAGQRLAVLWLDGTVQCVAWDRNDRFVLAGDNLGNLYRLEYREP